ncbi:phosphopantothenate--cysteine ligase Cab2p [Monosporozyma servazzii]
MSQPSQRHIFHTSTTDLLHAIDRTIDENIFPIAYTKEEQEFFTNNPKPTYLARLIIVVTQFLEHQRKQRRDKIVLITSGGTTVPLENNTVRFVDNFSAGTRGASSAEWFLQNGYSVIFLYREFSMTPFNRNFQHNALNDLFLDFFDVNGNLNPNYKHAMLDNKKSYELYSNIEQRLILIPFTTVTQYLWSLRSISQLMNEPGCLFYVAAAVSDFYIPFHRLPKHKIQSTGNDQTSNEKDIRSSNTTENGELIIKMDPVPKFLRRLVESWAPKAMLVSFKLETDPNLLLNKAQMSLKKYNHQLVIGNLLQSRKSEVVLISPDQIEGEWIKLNGNMDDNTVELESLIIPEVIKRHDQWVEFCFNTS